MLSVFENKILTALQKPNSEVAAFLRKLFDDGKPAEHLEPLGLSISKTAQITGDKPWTVQDKIRRGIYRARKSGRRTIVDFQSVKEAWESLPDWKDAKQVPEKAIAAAVAARARQRAARRDSATARRASRKPTHPFDEETAA